MINAALLNVYFILRYHSVYFFIKKFTFSNVHISVNTIFKCIYMFFGWERSHQLNRYATGGRIGERGRGGGSHPKCVKLRIGGGSVIRTSYLRLILTHLHYLYSCFWQHFCLIVPCFICRNLTLSLMKKDVFIRNGHFSPTR